VKGNGIAYAYLGEEHFAFFEGRGLKAVADLVEEFFKEHGRSILPSGRGVDSCMTQKKLGIDKLAPARAHRSSNTYFDPVFGIMVLLTISERIEHCAWDR
jgi:hypothetical protein